MTMLWMKHTNIHWKRAYCIFAIIQCCVVGNPVLRLGASKRDHSPSYILHSDDAVLKRRDIQPCQTCTPMDAIVLVDGSDSMGTNTPWLLTWTSTFIASVVAITHENSSLALTVFASDFSQNPDLEGLDCDSESLWSPKNCFCNEGATCVNNGEACGYGRVFHEVRNRVVDVSYYPLECVSCSCTGGVSWGGYLNGTKDILTFSEGKDRSNLNKTRDIQWIGGSTWTATALQHAREALYGPGTTAHHRKVVVIVFDGQSSDRNPLSESVLLAAMGIEFYIVSIDHIDTVHKTLSFEDGHFLYKPSPGITDKESVFIQRVATGALPTSAPTEPPTDLYSSSPSTATTVSPRTYSLKATNSPSPSPTTPAQQTSIVTFTTYSTSTPSLTTSSPSTATTHSPSTTNSPTPPSPTTASPSQIASTISSATRSATSSPSCAPDKVGACPTTALGGCCHATQAIEHVILLSCSASCCQIVCDDSIPPTSSPSTPPTQSPTSLTPSSSPTMSPTTPPTTTPVSPTLSSTPTTSRPLTTLPTRSPTTSGPTASPSCGVDKVEGCPTSALNGCCHENVSVQNVILATCAGSCCGIVCDVSLPPTTSPTLPTTTAPIYQTVSTILSTTYSLSTTNSPTPPPTTGSPAQQPSTLASTTYSVSTSSLTTSSPPTSTTYSPSTINSPTPLPTSSVTSTTVLSTTYSPATTNSPSPSPTTSSPTQQTSTLASITYSLSTSNYPTPSPTTSSPSTATTVSSTTSSPSTTTSPTPSPTASSPVQTAITPLSTVLYPSTTIPPTPSSTTASPSQSASTLASTIYSPTTTHSPIPPYTSPSPSQATSSAPSSAVAIGTTSPASSFRPTSSPTCLQGLVSGALGLTFDLNISVLTAEMATTVNASLVSTLTDMLQTISGGGGNETTPSVVTQMTYYSGSIIIVVEFETNVSVNDITLLANHITQASIDVPEFGSTTIAFLISTDGGLTTCTSATNGSYTLNGSTLLFCDGTSWYPKQQVLTFAPPSGVGTQTRVPTLQPSPLPAIAPTAGLRASSSQADLTWVSYVVVPLFVVFVSLGVWCHLRHRKPRRAKHQINPTTTTNSGLTPQSNAWVTDAVPNDTGRGSVEVPDDIDDDDNITLTDVTPTLLTESPYDVAMEYDDDDDDDDDDDRRMGNPSITTDVESPYDEAAAYDVDDDDGVDVVYEYVGGDSTASEKTDMWEAPYDRAAPDDDDDDDCDDDDNNNNDDDNVDMKQVDMMVESPYDEAAADDDFDLDEHVVVIDLDTLNTSADTHDEHLATDLDGDNYEPAYDEAAPDDGDEDDEEGDTYGNTFEADYDEASPITDETEDVEVEQQDVVYTSLVFDQNRDTLTKPSTQGTCEDTIYTEVIARPRVPTNRQLQQHQPRTSSTIIQL